MRKTYLSLSYRTLKYVPLAVLQIALPQFSSAGTSLEHSSISGSANPSDWERFNPQMFKPANRLVPGASLVSQNAGIYMHGNPAFPHDPSKANLIFGRGTKSLPTEIYAKAFDILQIGQRLFQAPEAGQMKRVVVNGESVTIYGTSCYTPLPDNRFVGNPVQVSPFDPAKIFYRDKDIWPSVIYGKPGTEVTIANHKFRFPEAGQSATVTFAADGRLKLPGQDSVAAARSQNDNPSHSTKESGSSASKDSSSSGKKNENSSQPGSNSQAVEKAAAEKAASEKAAVEKATAEKAAAEKAAVLEKTSVVKAAVEKATAEKAAAEKAAAEKAAVEKAENSSEPPKSTQAKTVPHEHEHGNEASAQAKTEPHEHGHGNEASTPQDHPAHSHEQSANQALSNLPGLPSFNPTRSDAPSNTSTADGNSGGGAAADSSQSKPEKSPSTGQGGGGGGGGTEPLVFRSPSVIPTPLSLLQPPEKKQEQKVEPKPVEIEHCPGVSLEEHIKLGHLPPPPPPPPPPKPEPEPWKDTGRIIDELKKVWGNRWNDLNNSEVGYLIDKAKYDMYIHFNHPEAEPVMNLAAREVLKGEVVNTEAYQDKGRQDVDRYKLAWENSQSGQGDFPRDPGPPAEGMFQVEFQINSGGGGAGVSGVAPTSSSNSSRKIAGPNNQGTDVTFGGKNPIQANMPSSDIFEQANKNVAPGTNAAAAKDPTAKIAQSIDSDFNPFAGVSDHSPRRFVPGPSSSIPPHQVPGTHGQVNQTNGTTITNTSNSSADGAPAGQAQETPEQTIERLKKQHEEDSKIWGNTPSNKTLTPSLEKSEELRFEDLKEKIKNRPWYGGTSADGTIILKVDKYGDESLVKDTVKIGTYKIPDSDKEWNLRQFLVVPRVLTDSTLELKIKAESNVLDTWPNGRKVHSKFEGHVKGRSFWGDVTYYSDGVEPKAYSMHGELRDYDPNADTVNSDSGF